MGFPALSSKCAFGLQSYPQTLLRVSEMSLEVLIFHAVWRNLPTCRQLWVRQNVPGDVLNTIDIYEVSQRSSYER